MAKDKAQVEKVANPAEVQHCTGCGSPDCTGKKA